MSNWIRVISPYWNDGTWIFDDPALDIKKEPFVSGVPEMINEMVKDIADAMNGFRLTFSEKPFPSFQKELTWVREEDGGNWYRTNDPPMEGWLCPVLYKYFKEAPKKIYVKADPR